MGKNKKNQKSNQKPSANKQSKKASQIFKVASSSNSKKSQKKTKEIPKKLKQLDLKTKDKADQQLKNLHLKMVSKKEVKEPKAVGKKKLPAANTDNVQADLDKMNVN
jgi:hypothetical protein